ETFLLNLLRGAGLAGLSSMAPISGRTIRPLIETKRDEIETFLEQKQVTWRTDASNFNIDFARNRLRHIVIPQLSSDFNPNLLDTLARTIEILETEDSWTRSLVEEWLALHGTKQGPDFVVSLKPLQGKPIAMVRRVLRGAVRAAGSDLRDMSFEHME